MFDIRLTRGPVKRTFGFSKPSCPSSFTGRRSRFSIRLANILQCCKLPPCGTFWLEHFCSAALAGGLFCLAFPANPSKPKTWLGRPRMLRFSGLLISDSHPFEDFALPAKSSMSKTWLGDAYEKYPPAKPFWRPDAFNVVSKSRPCRRFCCRICCCRRFCHIAPANLEPARAPPSYSEALL